LDNENNTLLEEALLDSLEKALLPSESADTPPSDVLFIIPVLRRPFFPGMASPLLIEPGPYYKLLKVLANNDSKTLGIVLTKSETADIKTCTLEDLHPVGVQAKILRVIPMENGGAQVILNLEKRIKILEPVEDKYLRAKVEYHEDASMLTDELKAYAMSITATIKEILKLNPLFKEELQIFLGHSDFTEPSKLADFAVALTTASREEQQEILAEFDLRERVSKALILLRKELDLSTIQQEINKRVEAAISKNQKEFVLKEQLKTIKKELGLEKEDKVLEREKFEERLKTKIVPADVAKVINEELEKFSALDPHASEYAVCRGYLDWLTVMPWGLKSEECHDIDKAEAVLPKIIMV